MPIDPYLDSTPKLGQPVFLAPSVEVSGDIDPGDDVSFSLHTGARGDAVVAAGAQTGAIADCHATLEARHRAALGETS